MKQTVPCLRVNDISEAKKSLKEMKESYSTVTVKDMSTEIWKMEVWNLSDASFNISSVCSYGKIEIVTGLMVYGFKYESASHPIDWVR